MASVNVHCCQSAQIYRHGQWGFVGSKARQHWPWYAYNTKTSYLLSALSETI